MSRLTTNKKRWTFLGVFVGAATTLALVIGLGVLAGAGAAASSAKPVNTGPPSISGVAQVGKTLTASDGAWTGATSFKYFWTRCSKSGNSCSNISGATTKTYTLTSADLGTTLRFKVQAINADGSTTLSSDQTEVVTASGGSGPRNTSPPTISGTAQEGSTLRGDRGNWTDSPTDYNYYWLRCDKNGNKCATIGSAGGQQNYKLTSADVGDTLRFRVQAKNADGTTNATSAQTAVVTAGTAPPPTPATGCPSGTGTVPVASVSSPARLLIDRQQTEPTVANSGTRQLIARYHVTACGGRPVQGALVYATAVPFNQLNIPAEAATNADGWAEVDFRMIAGYPVSSKQQLIAIFTRARKSGEDPLGGISTRRLFSVPVRLNG